MMLARLCLLVWLGLGAVGPALAQGGFPPESWVLTYEMRRYPVQPDCRLKGGKGKIEASKKGETLIYRITGFPDVDGLVCTVPSGRSWELGGKGWFNSNKTFSGKGKPVYGQIGKVDVIFTYRRAKEAIIGEILLHGANGTTRMSGMDSDAYAAIHGIRYKEGRWK